MKTQNEIASASLASAVRSESAAERGDYMGSGNAFTVRAALRWVLEVEPESKDEAMFFRSLDKCVEEGFLVDGPVAEKLARRANELLSRKAV